MHRLLWVFLCAFWASMGAAATAQHHGTSSDPSGPGESVALYDNLGSFHRQITTESADAQAYFDQGMLLAYAFGRREAAASFREAQRRDPECAMCFWGEAWALGPYINEPMYEDAVADAYRAVQEAVSLAPTTADVEQALIEAMAVRYAPAASPPRRSELDSAYADATRDVVRLFPHDFDAAALFAEALMVLRPWDHWTAEGQPQPGTNEAIAVLESVLGRDIKHAGACHLYIHLVEASPVPSRAEPCADYLAAGIPGASHIRHMPSHIYMQLGRYGDSVRANQMAWRMDQLARHGEAVAIYPEHNLHMLVFAAWMDGQSAVAIQAARDLAERSPSDAFYPSLLLARFGRWDEVLEMSTVPSDPFHEGLWIFSRGLAHLRSEEPDSARSSMERLAQIVESTPDSMRYGFVGHRQKDLLTIAAGILRGELAASEGRLDEAEGALRQAIAVEDALAYDEPEPWPIPSRQVLGGVLLEGGRPADAEQVFRDDLADYPMNGWSLLGLAHSLRDQGRQEEADAVLSDFERAWERSDVWLPSSRF